MTPFYMLIGVVVLYMIISKLTTPKVTHMQMDTLMQHVKGRSKDYQFIDVRTAGEFSTRKIKGFHNIPLSQLNTRLKEIKTDVPVILICASGNRSMQAARVLAKAGYKDLINVRGGLSTYKG